jgi:hypothetical protein
MKTNEVFFSILPLKVFGTHFTMMYSVGIFTMMIMFVNYINTRYTKARIYQGLNPRLDGNTPRS